jgi:signal transduction histidine kinase
VRFWTVCVKQVTIRGMRGLRWVWLVLGAAAVAGLGTAALLAAHRHPDESLGGGAAPFLALQLLAGLGASSAGAHLARQHSTRVAGLLLLAAGVAVFLEQLPLPDSGGALLFTAALAGGALTSALAGTAALAAASPRLRHLDALVGGAALAASGLVLGVLPAATFDPKATGCFACRRNLLLVHGDARLNDTLVRAGLTAAALSCAALALLVLLRVILRPPLLRSTVAPLVVCGAAVAALGAIQFLLEPGAGQPEVDSTSTALWLAQCGILAAGAASISLSAYRARLLRGRVAAMVLAALPSPEELRGTLARTLGDPKLEVVFPRADGEAVDANGRAAATATGDAAITEVVRRGEVVAELRHAAELAQTPERVAQAALGAGLALEHAAQHARLRAELAELTASRARIVEVGDAERRRLERNLHDGAQQRLIALSLALQLSPNADPDRLRAREALQGALENLRGIAHGIHPVSLSEAGLTAAVRELAQSSRVPVRIEAAPGPRPPPPVEAALYRLVLDCVRLAERAGNRDTVTVRVDVSGALVRTRVMVPGVESVTAAVALEHAADRLATVSGKLTSGTTGTGLIVEASLQCGS